jgi:hypothetical protein
VEEFVTEAKTQNDTIKYIFARAAGRFCGPFSRATKEGVIDE